MQVRPGAGEAWCRWEERRGPFTLVQVGGGEGALYSGAGGRRGGSLLLSWRWKERRGSFSLVQEGGVSLRCRQEEAQEGCGWEERGPVSPGQVGGGSREVRVGGGIVEWEEVWRVLESSLRCR